jgi:hypothetical protein
MVNFQQLRKQRRYEVTANQDEVLRDLAAIKTADKRAERLRNRVWWVLSAVLVPLVIWGSGTVAVVVGGAAVVGTFLVWRALGRLDFENRRYEFAYGLLQSLQVAPGAQLAVFIDFRPLDDWTFRDPHSEQGWDHYRQRWLSIDGVLADGMPFSFARTSTYSYHRHKRYEGFKTITYEREVWKFYDELAFRPGPGRFPRVEALGPSFAHHLGLGELAVCESVTNAHGVLGAVVRCDYKWDAGPGRAGFNAVPLAAAMFERFYSILGIRPMVDVAASRSATLGVVDEEALGFKDPLSARRWLPVGLVAGGALLSSFGAITAYEGVFDREWHEQDVARAKAEVKRIKACASDADQGGCPDEDEYERELRRAKSDQEVAVDAQSDVAQGVVTGGLMGAVGLPCAVVGIVWLLRRRKNASSARATVASAASLTMPP